MKVKVKEDVIRERVSRFLCRFGVEVESIEMPSRADGPVSVALSPVRSSTRPTLLSVYLPNWQLAEIVHGDNWDGDAADDAFRFGGGGYDPVWFECGVRDPALVS